MTNMMNMSDFEVLELANSTTADGILKESLGYDALKGLIVRYLNQKNEQNTVDYLEVLQINDIFRQTYLKDFVVIVSTPVAGKTRILALQYRKKPVFLNIANQLRKMFKRFLKVTKIVFDPQIKIEPRKDIGSRVEIEEWMR